MENEISVKGTAIQHKGKAIKGGILQVSISILKSERSSPKPETQAPPVEAREFLPAQAEPGAQHHVPSREGGR